MNPPRADDPNEWDGVERRKNITAAQSWPAVVQATLSVLVVMIGGIAWGLKLEARIDTTSQQVADSRKHTEDKLEAMVSQVNRGILPIAQLRVERLEEEFRQMRSELNDCLGRGKR